MDGLGKFNYYLLFVNGGSAYYSETIGDCERGLNIAVHFYHIIASVNQAICIRGRNCVGGKRRTVRTFDDAVALRT